MLFAFDQPYLAVLTIFSMAWHELFHVLALMRIAKRAHLRTHLSGLRLFPSGTLSYREERYAAAAGPIGGFIGAFFCLLLSPLAPAYLYDFALCHLLTSLSNLFPIEGYDGYRILQTTLSLRGGDGTHTTMKKISFVFSAVLSLFSLFLFGILGQGLWASSVFLFSLLCSLPEEKDVF